MMRAHLSQVKGARNYGATVLTRGNWRGRQMRKGTHKTPSLRVVRTAWKHAAAQKQARWVTGWVFPGFRNAALGP